MGETVKREGTNGKTTDKNWRRYERGRQEGCERQVEHMEQNGEKEKEERRNGMIENCRR